MSLSDEGVVSPASLSEAVLKKCFLSVAVPRPLKPVYYYQASEEQRSQLSVGSWVQVPFGASTVYGVVVGFPTSEEIAAHVGVVWKDILKVGDIRYRLSPSLFSLCCWVQDYYLTSLGEVCSMAMPLLSHLIQKTSSKKVPKKWVRTFLEQRKTLLKEEQQQAVSFLSEMQEASYKVPSVGLLQGVTGSGKTEVYMELARKNLEKGRSVLILVPEISLTPQLHQRFEEGLNQVVALWHSGMTPTQRKETYEAVRQGEVRILVGARSAVFLPFVQLGLIVIDEEHDSSYKQEGRGRYHARDLAIVRAQKENAFVVLGSATPSLETQERVKQKKYVACSLTQRVLSSHENQIHIVDLSVEPRLEGVRTPLALSTLEAIRATLASGEQVMVYLNKRGYASFFLCVGCGFVKQCENCAVSLTFYQKSRRLQCHVCGVQEKMKDHCPQCFGVEWVGKGVGTEGLEEDLSRLLPESRLARLDRDEVTSLPKLQRILEDFRSKKTNLLIGTQMLVKGHDFPDVTLVVIILADALFYWPDFRATEKAYQVLKQVSGRAGRGAKPGTVFVQTFRPEHPILEVLQGTLDEKSFWETESQLRQFLNYPPFGRLARFRVEAFRKEEALFRAKALVHFLGQEKEKNPLCANVEILGPSEAFLEKAHKRYRWDLVMKSPSIQALQVVLRQAQAFCWRQEWNLFSIDVDPYQL